MDSFIDCIELKLPFKAEYVSVARLAVSGIANRMGFDIEAIEDIKVAVSEVCSKLVSIGSKIADGYVILFEIANSSLNIIYDCDDKALKCIFDEDADEMPVLIIKSLMTSLELGNSGSYILSMTKTKDI
jgi:serine/threonine-protein kinase RsbW